MRMRKITIIYVLLSLIAIGIVKESIWNRPKFKLDDESRTKLAQMPGQIKLIFGSDNIWYYTIVNGELLLQSIEEHRKGWKEEGPYIYFSKDVPNGLPKIEGSKYYGPYRLSPDKSLMFLSLSSKERYFPRDFVLIQMAKKELLLQKKNKHWIEDMAWSPDSNMFAVLSKPFRIYLGVEGILGFIFGHPVMVCKYYLSIYDRQGNLLINTKVASGLVDGGGQVSLGGEMRCHEVSGL